MVILNDWDYLIIDTATGLGEDVLGFTRSARDVIMVICDEPTSIAGTYALIKLLNKRHHLQQFHVLVNRVRHKNEGSRVYNKLLCITEKFLDVRLNYIGAIPFDNMVHKALKAQKLIMAAYTESSAAIAIQQLARTIDKWPVTLSVSENTSFFTEKLMTE